MGKNKIVIIGGGITGLTAAYYLQKENIDAEITLIEQSDRLGGKIQTEEKDGFTIERGPDSILERKPAGKRLIEELGLADQIVHNATGQAFILSQDHLHPIPKGGFMGIPTKVTPYAFSSLFSISGKVAALKDLVRSRSEVEGDISVGQFFRRRLGNQVVDRLIHPLISGIYAGDIDRLSLMATFPNFYQLEQNHRSLMLGLKKTMPKKRGGAKSAFITLNGGLQKIVDALENELTSTNILRNTKVKHIEKNAQNYTIHLVDEEEVLDADHIVMTTPHQVTSKIFSQYDFMHKLMEVKNTSVANVVLAFNENAVHDLPNGTGFVVSRKEQYRMTACTWTHKKWPHTTPEGYVLMRVYVGKPGDEELIQESDEHIKSVVLEDLQSVIKIDGDPIFHMVTRWNEAMPQYTVGHLERLKELENKMAEKLPNVYLAGNAYRGVGIPDCMDQAVAIADGISKKIN
ncbi:protoporphyrinogen oxidase [Halalkalibacillus sediminis]|uniref:Coproporphyrinogen III oxidase n=1 Tax=Halalkalibacillus sediminis TaxID=2018042 RepID=A0A2I0QVD5_9BACI|nr:protoporphyrinogen oxidase [Halalkalibacillus sediminis]PKR78296.1 protoporphyrinogen oxidase [Halalkalibacillus sediminis]